MEFSLDIASLFNLLPVSYRNLGCMFYYLPIPWTILVQEVANKMLFKKKKKKKGKTTLGSLFLWSVQDLTDTKHCQTFLLLVFFSKRCQNTNTESTEPVTITEILNLPFTESVTMTKTKFALSICLILEQTCLQLNLYFRTDRHNCGVENKTSSKRLVTEHERHASQSERSTAKIISQNKPIKIQMGFQGGDKLRIRC